MRYLNALFEDTSHGFIEVRFREQARMIRAFYPVGHLAAVGSKIVRVASQADVYVGVLPRERQVSGRAAVVAQAQVLWADCDCTAAAAALDQFAAPPQLLVASGSGENRHAYWILARPVSLDTIEFANRRLAQLLGADGQCVDAARILRPPSTNHKHEPPRPVRLLRCDMSRRYPVDDVVGSIDVADIVRRRPRIDRDSRVGDDPLLGLEPARYVAQLLGVDVPRQRKVQCPFHADGTPSLHVYDDPERGWYCFGCGRGGSIYDFAGLLWKMPTRGSEFPELRRRLDLLFDLTDLS